MMLRVVFVAVAARAAIAEPEECPLLQLRNDRRDTARDAMERTKLESNVSASRKFPSGPKDDVQRLSPQQWALAGRALLCAASTYRSASEASSQCGRILKEVEGKHPDGSDFMMARVIRSEDGQFAGKCWVAFRGTASKEGWKANFNAMGKKEPFSEGHKVWVASSWKHCYRTLQSGLREALLEAYKKGDCDPEQIYYTGHSLGGVLANYAALDNLAGNLLYTVNCITLMQRISVILWQIAKIIYSCDVEENYM